VKPEDRLKTYDGETLKPVRAEIISGTLLSGHSLDTSKAVFSGSITDIGTSVSRVSGIGIAGTDTANYAISYATGKLTVLEPEHVWPEEENLSGRLEEDKGSGSGGASDSGSSGGGTQTVVNPPGGTDGDEGEQGTEPGDDDGDGGQVEPPVPPKPDTEPEPPADDDTEIDEEPTPVTGGGIESEAAYNPIFFWLWIILIAIALAAIWFIVAWRRRGRDDDDGQS
jgi:hypothetical protein